MGIRAAIGICLIAAGGCASHDESLGCAELVVSCPAGTEQQWWLAQSPTLTSSMLRIQGGCGDQVHQKCERNSTEDCGSWLAYIQNDAWARYDNIDLGNREGTMRLRAVVAASDQSTSGGTLSLFADVDPTMLSTATAVTSCTVGRTGGWFNWVIVDCGPISLTGVHTLVFKFNTTDPKDTYAFNLAAFGVVRSGSPDCSVTGPKGGDKSIP